VRLDCVTDYSAGCRVPGHGRGRNWATAMRTFFLRRHLSFRSRCGDAIATSHIGSRRQWFSGFVSEQLRNKKLRREKFEVEHAINPAVVATAVRLDWLHVEALIRYPC
jgi:hypothetical protein